MLGHYLHLTLLLLAVMAAAARAESPSAVAAEDGMVLLANGQVLSGKVTRAGDYYYVLMPTGEIRLRAAEVELFCHDLEEGYARKRAALVPGQIQDHLNLAHWCIQQGLFGYAARELSAAMAIDRTHPKIALLERRLELAREHRDLAPPTGDRTVRHVSSEDLDRMTRGMPHGTVEAFAQTIQPLLLNHCSTAGCHGPSSSTRFSMLRIPLGEPASRRLTQRNLHAAMQHISTGDPASSPLLVNSIGVHGTAKTPVFTSREAVQYQQLMAWVYRVAQTSGTSSAAVSDPWPAKVPAHVVPPPSNRPQPNGSGPESAGQKDAGAPAANGPPAPAPVDPFDPEVFNRQSSP
jgi:hypothetical protein